MGNRFSKVTALSMMALALFTTCLVSAETLSANPKTRVNSPPPQPSLESQSWTTDLVNKCKGSEVSEFIGSLERSRRTLSAELNKLKPDEYKKLNNQRDSRVVFMDMTWPKDVSFANDHFSNDSDRTYCAKLHKTARDNVASTSTTKAAAMQAIRDFENCANLQFNGNNERPLPSPLRELVACYRGKAQSKQ